MGSHPWFLFTHFFFFLELNTKLINVRLCIKNTLPIVSFFDLLVKLMVAKNLMCSIKDKYN